MAATLAVHAALVLGYLARYGGDPSALLCAGQAHVGRPPYGCVHRALGPSGDDGQFYYALARSPWRVHGSDLDVAACRHLRILYPAVCWLCSGGRPRVLFYVMPAVNLLATAGIAWLGVLLALRCGRSPWWGFLLPLACNAGISLLHDFTDCVSTLAVVGLLTAWLLRWRSSTLLLWAAAAVFSREQNVAVVGVVAAAAAWQRRPRLVAGLAAVLVLWTAWVALLWRTYGQAPFFAGSANLTTPLAGLAYRWTHLGDAGGHFSRRLAVMHFLSALHLTLLLPLGVAVARRPPSRLVALVLLAGTALAVVGGTGIYVGFWSYTRVFVWIPIGVWLACVPTARRWPLFLLAPAALWPVMGVLHYV